MKPTLTLLAALLLAPLAALNAADRAKERLAPESATISRVPENDMFQQDKSELILRSDYERRSSLSGKGVVAEGPSAKDAFSISDQKPRSGKYCLRTKVARSKDYISADAHRAETSTMKLMPSRYNEGEVFRYQFSVRLEEDWQFDSRDSVDIIWQFKRFDGGPDMFVAVKGKDFVLRCGSSGQWTLAQNVTPGEWMDFCAIVRWSVGPTGFVEAYYKRSTEEQYGKVASFQGPNMRSDAKPNSSYLKWGIYKPGMASSTATNPRVIYHDDIMVEKMLRARTSS